jgi:dipeptidyl aminopeptidase/acylaminoacyl peptidase
MLPFATIYIRNLGGGSHGGFMTLMAIGCAPDAFTAAVQL